jgi:hypothetical protein
VSNNQYFLKKNGGVSKIRLEGGIKLPQEVSNCEVVPLLFVGK